MNVKQSAIKLTATKLALILDFKERLTKNLLSETAL